ncbi:MAG TPA: class I SAM-dependent methyltransferase, partial [Verrucomicrobiae bacterium]|nr:class I SAM-dependent methyltransferase [Verrucomicrobiae bacterium]
MPRNWGPFLQSFRRRNGNHKAADDAQLKLYSQILPGGFLNYGYHEDTSLSPEKMSLDAIQRAQTRYGERLVDLVEEATGPVLDAGCGMGGLVQLLLQRGFAPTALTPNRAQIRHMRTTFPAVPLIEGRLEQIPLDTFQSYFQTVITSESFQYMDLRSTPGII